MVTKEKILMKNINFFDSEVLRKKNDVVYVHVLSKCSAKEV